MKLQNKRDLKTIFFNLNLFSGDNPETKVGFFTTYFVLARRANQYVVNPFAMSDTFNKIYILLKGMAAEYDGYSKWVFAFNIKHAAVARWFGWSTNSSVYAQLDRLTSIVSKDGLICSVKGILSCYTFINFIGVDLAFILSSRSSGGRAAMLTQKSILTIGFDGHEAWQYGYNLPGTRTLRSVLLYSRLFSLLLNKWVL